MNPGHARSVYRYFDPADAFVQIQICDGSSLELSSPPGLNRQSYRRLVIQTCMPEFEGDVSKKLEQLFPEDPMLAEDLLYQLCTEVNPGLDIHTVHVRNQVEAETSAQSKRPSNGPSAYDDYLRHLRRRATGMHRRLSKRIVGQNEGLEAVERAVQKAAAGLAAPHRPMAAFLFVGRTGTGKTELARCLADDLFANVPGANGATGTPGASAGSRGLVRVDCSEFALAHEYSKLIGAPPGYVGHEDGGQLTEAVARRPETVVLFDEIEKAHPRMHNLMLQILEEGVLTDGRGRQVSFDRTFVILTSNAGAEDIVAASKAVGFDRTPTLGAQSLRDITHSALEAHFSPEFLGRLDETTVFRELSPESACKIARRQLTELAARARGRGIKVAFTPAVARWIARRGFSPEFGARELKRVIQKEVESPLSLLILEESVRPDQLIRAQVKGDAIRLCVED